MSITKSNGVDKKATGWEGLILETRQRIERLEMAIEVFQENIRTGFPFDGELPAENSNKKATQASA